MIIGKILFGVAVLGYICISIAAYLQTKRDEQGIKEIEKQEEQMIRDREGKE